ncbi:MAG: DUF2933 domain-containing protein [Moritella sp.]|nr:DUF2933 domain-containing protein [Moritella sp.]
MNKLCKLMLVLCLGLPLAYFVLVGELSLVAISSLLVPLILCVAMMFVMMKMMGCDNKKQEDKEMETSIKHIERDKN